jgi:hypothetical protein
LEWGTTNQALAEAQRWRCETLQVSRRHARTAPDDELAGMPIASRVGAIGYLRSLGLRPLRAAVQRLPRVAPSGSVAMLGTPLGVCLGRAGCSAGVRDLEREKMPRCHDGCQTGILLRMDGGVFKGNEVRNAHGPGPFA